MKKSTFDCASNTLVEEEMTPEEERDFPVSPPIGGPEPRTSAIDIIQQAAKDKPDDPVLQALAQLFPPVPPISEVGNA